MTERIYYSDPSLAEFEATVTGVETMDGRQAVRLDRTAFYPTSGGQPHDLGTLGNARVIDVVDEENGDVLHFIEGEVVTGNKVPGRIDWTRRFDHMQQHTGQHVLSAAFDTLLKARTESFHLGADYATIDLARELTPAEIARAENDANRIVWEDRPVHIRFVDAAQAAALPLRKAPAREGTLRLIDVDGYDLSACGGTHVARTGAIGNIAVTGWERFKGGMRVGFVCGGRALSTHRRLRDVVTESARLLSTMQDELPAGIERLQADARESKRQIKDLQSRLAVHEAAGLAASAQEGVVVAALDGWDQAALKNIASAIAARPGFVAGLIGGPAPFAVVIARGTDRATDCGAVLKQLAARFGGKGGGRPELAQGGGLQGDAAEISDYLRSLL
ncbi:MAG TPA: DHHA1 domain-containing protein [Vicinamibacterales bacterium]|nr:DHHA1 domain-containing protein [Vicinamibacterales bacterium]